MMTEKNNYPVYTALSEDDLRKATESGLQFEICECSDCGNCGKCWDKNVKLIIVRIH